MKIDEIQQKEFEEITRPLIKWLNDNCSHAELLEGVYSFYTEKYRGRFSASLSNENSIRVSPG